jgi:Beta protein
VVVAGAAFPRDLGGVPKNAITRIPRSDWRLYSEVAAEAATTGQRVPTYGDYAVAHPDPTLTVNPRFLNISASLRYTSDDHWLVAKGAELFKGCGGGAGGEAIRPAAQMLVQDEEFCGQTSPRLSGQSKIGSAVGPG